MINPERINRMTPRIVRMDGVKTPPNAPRLFPVFPWLGCGFLVVILMTVTFHPKDVLFHPLLLPVWLDFSIPECHIFYKISLEKFNFIGVAIIF